jgi:hypothetical protein
MLRPDVMLVQGARSESPWIPGTASAWLIEGENHFSAVGVLTWSIAHVPHTDPAGAVAALDPGPVVEGLDGPPGREAATSAAAAAAAALGDSEGSPAEPRPMPSER